MNWIDNLPYWAYVLTIVVCFLLGALYYIFSSQKNDDLQQSSKQDPDHNGVDSIKKLIRIPLTIWIASILAIATIHITPWASVSLLDGDAITRMGDKIFQAVTVSVLFIIAIRLLSRSESQVISGQQKVSEELEHAVHVGYKVAKFVLYAILVICILNIFDLSYLANQLFAVGAVSSFIIGFAAQDSLANFFGSILVLIDRPFKVNDLIESPDKNIKGFVEHIGWRVTRVRDLQYGIKYIPNNNFTKITINNLTRSKIRKFSTLIGIRYDDLDRVASICSAIETRLAAIPDTAKNGVNYAKFAGLGASSVDIRLVCSFRCAPSKLFDAYVDTVMHTVVEVVKEHNADFPYPTTTLDAKELVDVLQDKKES